MSALSSMLHVHDGKLFSVNDYVDLGVINTLVHLEPTIVGPVSRVCSDSNLISVK